MFFTSYEFLGFITVLFILYYVIPGKYQWMLLLLASYFFYFVAGADYLIYILATTVTTWFAGCRIEQNVDRQRAWLKEHKSELSAEEKKEYKNRQKSIRVRWVLACLLINIGILAVTKYTNFFIANVNGILGAFGQLEKLSPVTLVLPLGISYYTFQSIGYLIDVYRGTTEAEKNPFKFALFVSFFPQILQGPIGRYDRLASQLYGQKCFSLTRIERGLQLMLWGYFKKIVIADRAAVVVSEVFGNYQSYHGILLIAGVLCYSLQLYGDFSGGMDVVMGAAECFGISLDANFKRPYFARSISDFWHRWHITLGTWMKDYVFYPFSLSKGMNKLGKYCKKHFGKHVSRVLPVCIANLLVFFLVGVWHGPAWKFIVYGLYNGIIIAASNLLAPIYTQMARKLHIPAESSPWTAVRILRTFLLVNISWYFDMAESLGAALAMMKNTVAGFTLSALTDGSLLRLGLDLKDCGALALSCVVLFTVSLLQENHVSMRDALAAKPLAARWCVYLMLLFSIPLLGQITMTGGGFIYAQF